MTLQWNIEPPNATWNKKVLKKNRSWPTTMYYFPLKFNRCLNFEADWNQPYLSDGPLLQLSGEILPLPEGTWAWGFRRQVQQRTPKHEQPKQGCWFRNRGLEEAPLKDFAKETREEERVWLKKKPILTPNLVLLFGRKYKDKKVRREERGHDQDWIKLGNQLVIYAVVLVFLNKQVTS